MTFDEELVFSFVISELQGGVADEIMGGVELLLPLVATGRTCQNKSSERLWTLGHLST